MLYSHFFWKISIITQLFIIISKFLIKGFLVNICRKGADRMLEEIRDFYFAHPNFTHNDIAAAAGKKNHCGPVFLYFIFIKHKNGGRLF